MKIYEVYGWFEDDNGIFVERWSVAFFADKAKAERKSVDENIRDRGINHFFAVHEIEVIE